jgi:hypothetical protein
MIPPDSAKFFHEIGVAVGKMLGLILALRCDDEDQMRREALPVGKACRIAFERTMGNRCGPEALTPADWKLVIAGQLRVLLREVRKL